MSGRSEGKGVSANLMLAGAAEAKWCPFSRVFDIDLEAGGAAAVNREEANSNARIFRHSRCQSSACMAWRWSDQSQRSMPLGYCGLAGSPLLTPPKEKTP